MPGAKRRRDNLIGQRIAEILAETGLKAIDLARALGVSSSAISQTLSGGGMTPENVFGVADFTGYEARWIATGRGPKQSKPAPPALSPEQRGQVTKVRGLLEAADHAARDEILTLLHLADVVAPPTGNELATRTRSSTNNDNRGRSAESPAHQHPHVPARPRVRRRS